MPASHKHARFGGPEGAAGLCRVRASAPSLGGCGRQNASQFCHTMWTAWQHHCAAERLLQEGTLWEGGLFPLTLEFGNGGCCASLPGCSRFGLRQHVAAGGPLYLASLLQCAGGLSVSSELDGCGCNKQQSSQHARRARNAPLVSHTTTSTAATLHHVQTTLPSRPRPSSRRALCTPTSSRKATVRPGLPHPAVAAGLAALRCSAPSGFDAAPIHVGPAECPFLS